VFFKPWLTLFRLKIEMPRLVLTLRVLPSLDKLSVVYITGGFLAASDMLTRGQLQHHLKVRVACDIHHLIHFFLQSSALSVVVQLYVGDQSHLSCIWNFRKGNQLLVVEW